MVSLQRAEAWRRRIAAALVVSAVAAMFWSISLGLCLGLLWVACPDSRELREFLLARDRAKRERDRG